MALHKTTARSLLGPQQNSSKATVMPAPTGGIDARAPTGNMPPDVSIFTYNMNAAEYGLLLRPGYREWCVDIDNGGSSGIHTVVAFAGVDPGKLDDRLFCMTNEGIWDVTNYDAPTFELAFGNNALGAGHGVIAHYVDQSGEDFLYYADALNGLFEYVNTTQTWQIAAGITGVDISQVSFVVVHKRRLWLVEEGTTNAYYLDIDSRQGAATPFYFGGKFPHGGRLAGLFNWTVDGGAGIDDMLVAVSTSGDVVVYQGEDPSAATSWFVRGTYYIGDIPRGRRFGNEYSGDLYLLSSFGVISMSDLLRGVDTQNPASHSLSFKVARPLRNEIRNKITEYGWEPKFMPSIGQLVVTIPTDVGDRPIQYSMNLSTEAWGFWRDVPILSIEDWDGKIFFGTADNRICVMDVNRDDVTIAPPAEGENGKPIDFSLLSTYTDLGEPALFKRIGHIRPNFYSIEKPTYAVKVLYDYNFGETAAPTPTQSIDPSGWDNGNWDEAIWTTQLGSGSSTLFGTSGMGRTATIALRGDSSTETRLISFDMTWTTGWPL